VCCCISLFSLAQRLVAARQLFPMLLKIVSCAFGSLGGTHSAMRFPKRSRTILTKVLHSCYTACSQIFITGQVQALQCWRCNARKQRLGRGFPDMSMSNMFLLSCMSLGSPYRNPSLVHLLLLPEQYDSLEHLVAPGLGRELAVEQRLLRVARRDAQRADLARRVHRPSQLVEQLQVVCARDRPAQHNPQLIPPAGPRCR